MPWATASWRCSRAHGLRTRESAAKEHSESRNAAKADAYDLATLINLAGEGMPEFLCSGMLDADELSMPLQPMRSIAAEAWHADGVKMPKHVPGAHGCDRLSLAVASENTGARRTQAHMGSKDVAAVPLVRYPGGRHGGNRVLLIKPTDARRTDTRTRC